MECNWNYDVVGARLVCGCIAIWCCQNDGKNRGRSRHNSQTPCSCLTNISKLNVSFRLLYLYLMFRNSNSTTIIFRIINLYLLEQIKWRTFNVIKWMALSLKSILQPLIWKKKENKKAHQYPSTLLLCLEHIFNAYLCGCVYFWHTVWDWVIVDNFMFVFVCIRLDEYAQRSVRFSPFDPDVRPKSK